MSSSEHNRPARAPDLATRARWQRWEMDSLERLRTPHPQAVAPDTNGAANGAANGHARELARELAAARRQAHAEGLKKGQREGYDKGFEAGHAKGFEAGHKEGLARGIEEGQATGQRKGHQDGLKRGAAEIRAQVAALQTLTQGCAQALDALEEDLGQALIQLAIRIAETVVHRELETRPDAVLEVVRQVLRDAPQNGHTLQLRLNPDDLALVQAHLADDPQDVACRLVADAQITRGGCVAEARHGSVDATLETRWQRVLGALGQLPGEAP